MTSTDQLQWDQTPPPAQIDLPRPDVADVETLFGDRREIRLMFRGEEYRLRITRNQKLILTK
jgi:hemin uptake protein HemP